MEYVKSYTTVPPPYSRLDDDNNHTNAQLQQPPLGAPLQNGAAPSDYPLAETKKDDTNVTINLGDPSIASPEFYQCVFQGFLCGCSLRTGCITVVVLYSLYMIFFTAIAITYFVITYVESKSDYFSSLWGFNVALFECCMASFIIGFICVGIHKQNPRRLHVAKWLMVVDLCLNLIEELQIAFVMDVFGLLIHLAMQVVPVYFVFVVHSYEAQLQRRASLTKEFSPTLSNVAVSNN